MKLFSRRHIAVVLASAFMGSAGALAADLNAGPGGPSVATAVRESNIGPTNNIGAGSARYLIPDGSNLFIGWGSETEKWYYTEVEPGKTYVIEAIDPYDDKVAGSFTSMGIYEADGTTTPPAQTQVNCGIESSVGGGGSVAEIAPAILNYGPRCVVRTYFPDGLAPRLNKRNIFIKVGHFGTNNAGQIRARESTMYGRWTTNGYDFHIELQNTTAEDMCIYVLFFPGTGLTYDSGTGTFGNLPINVQSVNVPAYGAAKTVLPANTNVGAGTAADNKRGTWRTQSCPGGPNYNPEALNISTYAFNPSINQYLYFFPSKARNGTSGSF